MKLKRLVLLLLCVFFFSTAVPQASAEQQTVLIYMLACDLETDSGAATKDLLEIMKASNDINELKIIVYIGGSEKLWFSGLEHARCYDLAFESGECTIINDLGRVTSAEQNSLLRFLNAYGTDGIDLILWGHGSGKSTELGYDDLFDRDTINLAELTGALKESGLHFRMIGFDACEMASEKMLEAVIPFAELFVGPSETEEINGWNYAELLPLLEKYSDYDELTNAFASEYRDTERLHLKVVRSSQ